eukprot:scaffold97901_cov18-Tisochrysis_lutea.AAC.1
MDFLSYKETKSLRVLYQADLPAFTLRGLQIDDGNTPLSIASTNGHDDIAQLLLGRSSGRDEGAAEGGAANVSSLDDAVLVTLDVTAVQNDQPAPLEIRLNPVFPATPSIIFLGCPAQSCRGRQPPLTHTLSSYPFKWEVRIACKSCHPMLAWPI